MLLAPVNLMLAGLYRIPSCKSAPVRRSTRTLPQPILVLPHAQHLARWTAAHKCFNLDSSASTCEVIPIRYLAWTLQQALMHGNLTLPTPLPVRSLSLLATKEVVGGFQAGSGIHESCVKSETPYNPRGHSADNSVHKPIIASLRCDATPP